MNKYSRQRELILKTLDENRTHPTADSVYEIIRKSIPKISLATVYRNLNLLADNGVIRRLEGVDGMYRYDADTTDHHHFVCNKCGSIFDVAGDLFPNLEFPVSEKLGFRVASCDITLRGLCENCILKN